MRIDERKLWLKYHKNKTKVNKAKLLKHYYLYIAKFSHRFYSSNTHIEYLSQDEIISTLTIALESCIDEFDIDMGFEFTTFCTCRMLGSIKDHYRKNDIVPRKTRETISNIRNFEQRFSSKEGRLPTQLEISEGLGIDLLTIDSIENHHPLEDLDPIVKSPENDILNTIDFDKFLKHLNEQELKVIKEFVIEKQRITESRQKYGVSVSRISQIKTKALKKLKEAIQNGGGYEKYER